MPLLSLGMCAYLISKRKKKRRIRERTKNISGGLCLLDSFKKKIKPCTGKLKSLQQEQEGQNWTGGK